MQAMSTALRFFLAAAAVLRLAEGNHLDHRLNTPCGRGPNSESVLMCGSQACPIRRTKDLLNYPSVWSNSLFNIYDTNGVDLTIDMCMAKEGLLHSASGAQATACSGNNNGNSLKQWYCGGFFTSNSCEFDEAMFDTSWECPQASDCESALGSSCSGTWECTTTGNPSTGTQGRRVLLRVDTPILNVGDTPFVLGGRSATSNLEADKKYRDYISSSSDNCHSHTHLENFAKARLCADPLCTVVLAEGTKLSFCLAETFAYGPDSTWSCSGPGTGAAFSCNGIQGLSPGCADLYATWTDGNWIDVTTVPRGLSYFLEIAVGAGCRNKDYVTCSMCPDINSQSTCEDETGCVWKTGQCDRAEWCCMDENLPDVWPAPQDSASGRCGSDPKCYLFQEPGLLLYDNNVGVVEVYLIDFDPSIGHSSPCTCTEGTEYCGDGICQETDEDCTSCPADCSTGCPCQQLSETTCGGTCSDGVDNDDDGDTDCDDSDCFSDEACLVSCINTSVRCDPDSNDVCCSDADTCVCANIPMKKGCKCRST